METINTEQKEIFDADYFKKLEQDGYRIIDIIAGDVTPTPEQQIIIDKVSQGNQDTFYSDILYKLTSERFSEEEAKKLWNEILKHKYIVSEKLGRNIGIHVATLDYLENIKNLIEVPKIIEETKFRKTLKFASTDPLTGLLNRRIFMEELKNKIKFKSDNDKFCVIMLDLDGFKNFNDKEGHQAGDIILQEFAGILKQGLREQDIAGRYGGDEFIVLLNNTDKINAVKIIDRIRINVEQEFKSINITLCAGIAEFPTDAEDLSGLISEADNLLYNAKQTGRNKIVYK